MMAFPTALPNRSASVPARHAAKPAQDQQAGKKPRLCAPYHGGDGEGETGDCPEPNYVPTYLSGLAMVTIQRGGGGQGSLPAAATTSFSNTAETHPGTCLLLEATLPYLHDKYALHSRASHGEKHSQLLADASVLCPRSAGNPITCPTNATRSPSPPRRRLPATAHRREAR